MQAPKRSRPIGATDHKQRVAAVESELSGLLTRIASDPEAGPWGKWAAKLLESDQAEGQTTPKK
ncbi:MAG: hypothetical protein C0467_07025 [Planctomycetaceae bacterium]|nr:hypothetical protein [Planctomycetaceae bacterium]